MRTTWLALLFSVPLAATGAPATAPATPLGFTVQSLQTVTAALPRPAAEQLAESALWRQAFVRCSPALDSAEGPEPLRIGDPKVELGGTTKDPWIKVTQRFECGLANAPDLAQRMASAKHVVLGRVLAVKPIADSGPISEHRAIWQTATIEVLEDLKGVAKPTSKLDVTFQASQDVAWYPWPKLHAGQEGIFVLQSGKTGLVVESPLDVHPRSQYQDMWQVVNTH